MTTTRHRRRCNRTGVDQLCFVWPPFFAIHNIRVFTRTIHGIPGSHASTLTAAIQSAILFLWQLLFVTLPERDATWRDRGARREEKWPAEEIVRWGIGARRRDERWLHSRNYRPFVEYPCSIECEIGMLLFPKSRPPLDRHNVAVILSRDPESFANKSGGFP